MVPSTWTAVEWDMGEGRLALAVHWLVEASRTYPAASRAPRTALDAKDSPPRRERPAEHGGVHRAVDEVGRDVGVVVDPGVERG
jgi:hypothetical protein